MTLQEQLNQFIRDYCASLDPQTVRGVSQVRLKETGQFVVAYISEAFGGDTLEIWSERAEFTIVYSQSHWHINDFEDGRQFEQLARIVKEDLSAIFQGELLTYSAWQGDRPLGGGCVRGTVNDAIQQGSAHFKKAATIYIKQWNQALITYPVETDKDESREII